MRPRLIAGVMSGTSADGVDVALVEIGPGWKWRLRSWHGVAHGRRLRGQILAAAGAEAAELARLHAALGESFGAAVVEACRAAGIRLGRLDLVACHGQTVYHAGGMVSLQLGDAARVAAATGTGVVSDFRSADIAAGGQGAPLVPWADYRLFRHRKRYRVGLNLGGIANITLLPPGCRPEAVAGFDTGPGNMVLDGLAQSFSGGRRRMDAGGAWALRGEVDRRLLARLLRHPYFTRRPPKSAGREEFGAAYVEALRSAGARLAPADVMATATALTAASVARGLAWGGEAALSAEVIVSGGGVHNRALMAALQRAAPGCRWRGSDELGVPTQAKEAIAFALLGEAHVRRQTGNLPQVTGAGRGVVLGSFTPAPARNGRESEGRRRMTGAIRS